MHSVTDLPSQPVDSTAAPDAYEDDTSNAREASPAPAGRSVLISYRGTPVAVVVWGLGPAPEIVPSDGIQVGTPVPCESVAAASARLVA
jgi:hypothetical protein